MVDGTLDFRAAIGDFVVRTVPDTKDTMESRVTDGYVVLLTSNRTRYVKVYNTNVQNYNPRSVSD